jgi:DNA-binding transcriptional LysR family regulator
MELRHLRYFTAVAENGGIGRASRLLNVSQSAISETVRDLELELGVPLFDRSNRRIRLTYHGEQFLEDAKAVLASADKAIANVRKSVRGEIGTLTIGFFVGSIGTLFPSIIKEFRRRVEGVQISLVEMAPSMQTSALQSGAIDIGFTRPVEPVHAFFLRSECFETEPLYAVLPKNHSLAKQRSIYMRELTMERFILNDRKYSPALFDKIISLCAEAGFSPTIVTTATVLSGVIALVEAGEGIAILPHGSKIFRNDALMFIPIADPSASIDIVVAWSPQHETPVLRPFLELVRRKRKKQTAMSRAE